MIIRVKGRGGVVGWWWLGVGDVIVSWEYESGTGWVCVWESLTWDTKIHPYRNSKSAKVSTERLTCKHHDCKDEETESEL